MTTWVCLIIGVALMLSAMACVIPRPERKRRNMKRTGKPRTKRTRLKRDGGVPDPAEELDEIDAYWGNSMPTGVVVHEPVPEIQTTPVKRAVELLPALQLASIASLDEIEPVHVSLPAPKVLGDAARDLGIQYFQYLLDNHSLPRGAVSLTNESNIIIAQNALKNRMQSLTLSHSAVAQRIGEQALCIFEPLELPVSNIDKAIEALEPIFKDKNTFFILENTDNVPNECLRHIPLICKHFNIPETNIFIRQQNGGFINYVEDVNNYVPERIDVWQMPSEFFSSLLDYAQIAFDEGDTETVLRTLAPLLAPLCQRVYTQGNFPKVLLAQALNLTGMTNKALQHEAESIACFEASLRLLREAEDYEAIKAVEANLGITMAMQKDASFSSLQSAAKHLENVIDLNKNDQEALMFLGHTYVRIFEITHKQSFLSRAQRTYAMANAIQPTPEIQQMIDALPVQQSAAKHNNPLKSAI